MKPKTQTVLIVLALIFSIIAFVMSVGPKITGHAVTRDDIYYNDGYVGIGESDPKYQLDVDGNSRFQDDLKVGENLSVSDSILVENKIGIGTSDPLGILHIKKDSVDYGHIVLDTEGEENILLSFSKNGIPKAGIVLNTGLDEPYISIFMEDGLGEIIISEDGNISLSNSRIGEGTLCVDNEAYLYSSYGGCPETK